MEKETRIAVGKLVGMLGSEHDGEVINAARAIRNRLLRDGQSFGDLVAVVGSSEPIVVDRKAPNPIVAAADKILRQRHRLASHELRFVESIRERATVSPTFTMSTKQANWLGTLLDRYR